MYLTTSNLLVLFPILIAPTSSYPIKATINPRQQQQQHILSSKPLLWKWPNQNSNPPSRNPSSQTLLIHNDDSYKLLPDTKNPQNTFAPPEAHHGNKNGLFSNSGTIHMYSATLDQHIPILFEVDLSTNSLTSTAETSDISTYESQFLRHLHSEYECLVEDISITFLESYPDGITFELTSTRQQIHQQHGSNTGAQRQRGGSKGGHAAKVVTVDETVKFNSKPIEAGNEAGDETQDELKLQASLRLDLHSQHAQLKLPYSSLTALISLLRKSALEINKEIEATQVPVGDGMKSVGGESKIKTESTKEKESQTGIVDLRLMGEFDRVRFDALWSFDLGKDGKAWIGRGMSLNGRISREELR